MNKEFRLANLKIIGFVVIAFLAGTVTSGAIASADKDKDNHNPITTLAAFCAKLDDKTGFPALVCTAFSSLETQITNISLTPGPQGPPGTSVTATQEPPGPHCANGGVKLTSASGINYVCNGGSSSTCPTGLTTCNNTCVNTQTDSNNCGSCGTVCTSSQTCSAGVCVAQSNGNQCTSASTCPTPSNSCQQSTCSAGTCGVINSAAGIACTISSQSGTCDGSGNCVTSCPAGQTTCNNTCVNTQTDSNNCGSCGTACAPLSNAVNACIAGACGISQCNSGYLNCDNFAGNGCEVNSQNDIKNCGACGHVCATGQSCAAGVCQ